jgi:hypothetical protein
MTIRSVNLADTKYGHVKVWIFSLTQDQRYVCHPSYIPGLYVVTFYAEGRKPTCKLHAVEWVEAALLETLNTPLWASQIDLI